MTGEEWRRQYDAEQRRHKRGVWRVKDEFSGAYVAGYVFGEEVAEGGWYNTDGKIANWMTAADLKAATRRAWQRSEDSAPKETVNDTTWIPHQCGGCRYFAALNADWGFCLQEASPNDGRVVFEHGGCNEHSALVRS